MKIINSPDELFDILIKGKTVFKINFHRRKITEYKFNVKISKIEYDNFKKGYIDLYEFKTDIFLNWEKRNYICWITR